MQCVILAGGLGTRMRPMTDLCPKTLLPVRGKPFAYHQMHWLAAHGVTEVVYSIGHQGDRIRRYWAFEPSPVEHIEFVDEGEQLRGTGGALKLALEQGVLQESFFVIYGDSFLPVPFTPIWEAFERSHRRALMTVLRNEGRWDRSNAIYRDGEVTRYDKKGGPSMEFIDYGLSAMRRDLLQGIAVDSFDLAAVFQELSERGQLAGFEVSERFYEIGSPQGLRDLEEYFEAREAASCPR